MWISTVSSSLWSLVSANTSFPTFSGVFAVVKWLWNLVPGTRKRNSWINSLKNLAIWVLLGTLLMSWGWLRVPGLWRESSKHAGSQTEMQDVTDAYWNFGQFVQKFAASSDCLDGLYTNENNLERMRSQVDLMAWKSTKILIPELDSAVAKSYQVTIDYSKFVEWGYSIVLTASAHYNRTLVIYDQYEQSGNKKDKLRFVKALISNAESLHSELGGFSAHVNNTHANVMDLKLHIVNIAKTKDQEAKNLGTWLSLNTTKRSATGFVRNVFMRMGGRFDYLLLDDLHSTCEHAKNVITEVRESIHPVQASLEILILKLRQIEEGLTGHYDDRDLAETNVQVMRARDGIQMIMLRVSGHPNLLEKAGNVERMKEDVKDEV